MAEFQIIETQEQFDSAIKARLEREKNKYSEQLADYEEVKASNGKLQNQVNELTNALNLANEQIKNHSNEIAERDSKIATYEKASVKTKVAHEFGLSFDAIDFLNGDDEESIRKSAESLKALVGKQAVAPLATSEPPISGDNAAKEAELKTILSNLRKGD